MPEPAGPTGAAAPLVDGDADVSADVLGAEDAAAEDAAVDVLAAGEAPPCDVGDEAHAAKTVAIITSNETNRSVRLNIEILLCNVEQSDNA